MDVLADVFAAARIGGMIFASCELRSPWAMRFDRTSKAGFHVVARGTCWLRPQGGGRPLQLVQGDVVLLPRGWTHTLADQPDRKGQPWDVALAKQARGAAKTSEPSARVICGAYAFDGEGGHPLLDLLPPVLHVSAAASEDVGQIVRMLTREVPGGEPGSPAVASRLVDVLFIYVVRAWLASQPAGTSDAGWLGALRDASIGKALALLHDRVSEPWTVESLAVAVGMSRAALARRFHGLVGVPPLAYLTRWRMMLAARDLRETDRPMAAIARDIGYDSEFAFNRAFKRERGVAPGKYRKAPTTDRTTA